MFSDTFPKVMFLSRNSWIVSMGFSWAGWTRWVKRTLDTKWRINPPKMHQIQNMALPENPFSVLDGISTSTDILERRRKF